MRLTLVALAYALFIFQLPAAHCQERSAQEQKDIKNGSKEGTEASELVLEFARIENQQRQHQIFDILNRLHGRKISVVEQGRFRSIVNLQCFGKTLIIYDTKKAVKKIKTTLARLDILDQSEKIEEPRYVVLEYSPSFISLNDAAAALTPFNRRIDVSEVHEKTQDRSNVTYLEGRGLIILRDRKEHVTKMLDLLKQVDKPKSQFLVSCLLIQGTTEALANPNLKNSIPVELAQVSPYKHFKTISSGVIRVSSGNGEKVSLSMSESHGVAASVNFFPTSYDKKSGTLGLSNVFVELTQPNGKAGQTRQTFGTTTSISKGEYVVIGAFGENPIFAVLRFIALN